MCGQFTLEVEENQLVWEMVLDVKAHYPDVVLNTGIIKPTHIVPAVVKIDGKTKALPMKWGFPKWNGSGVVINARSETAAYKPMFRDCFAKRRCVIPTTGFFEWTHDEKNQKYRFRRPNESLLYLAGIFLPNDIPRFTVLTTAANESMADVHERMPVVLSAQNANQWLRDADFAAEYVKETMPDLERAEQ